MTDASDLSTADYNQLFAPSRLQGFARRHAWFAVIFKVAIAGTMLGGGRGLIDHSPSEAIVFGVAQGILYGWLVRAAVDKATRTREGLIKHQEQTLQELMWNPRSVDFAAADVPLFLRVLHQRREAAKGTWVAWLFLFSLSGVGIVCAVAQFRERAWVVSAGWLLLAAFTASIAALARSKSRNGPLRFAAVEQVLTSKVRA